MPRCSLLLPGGQEFGGERFGRLRFWNGVGNGIEEDRLVVTVGNDLGIGPHAPGRDPTAYGENVRKKS